MFATFGMAAEEEIPISPTNTPIRLFNGRDLSGFYSWLVDTKFEDPRKVFTVTNGAIRISGDGLGYLSTRRSYQNYHLIAEFQWGSRNSSWGDRLGKARDSGIFLHTAGPDGNSRDGHGAFKAGIECQVMQGAVGDILLIRGTNSDGSPITPSVMAPVEWTWSGMFKDEDGWPYWMEGGRRETVSGVGRINWARKSRRWRDQLDFRGERDVEIPIGSWWPQIECICDGGQITVKVNGQIVNQVLKAFPASGRILLQCEGSEIFFRKLDLHPIRKR